MALFNIKNKENKKKGSENIVGKIIYIFLLFAPLFSILTTSLYTIFNKNAFESYYGETINETTYTPIANLREDLKLGETYYLSKNEANIQSTSNIGSYATALNVTNVHIISTSVTLTINEEDIISIAPYYNAQYYGNKIDISLRTANNSQIVSYANELILTFDYQGNNLTSDWTNANFIFNINYNKYSYLDNSFDYGIYKTEQNNLFNWAKNTGTYTIMKTTTDGLEINNTFVPMLLTYWLIISVIYFIYDIALMLIWILHRKIHELTESV